MEDQTQGLYYLRERMIHLLNQATILTDVTGDNVGVFIDIKTWREMDKTLQKLDV